MREDTMKLATRFILAVLFALALSQVAQAQQGSGSGPGPGGQEWAGKSATPEQFKDKKARVLKMIEERRTKLDQAKTCVEAAQTDEDLQKCRPERPMGMGPGGMRRGGGMQGGGMRGQQQPMPPADQQ
jgi:hypothetical protein